MYEVGFFLASRPGIISRSPDSKWKLGTSVVF